MAELIEDVPTNSTKADKVLQEALEAGNNMMKILVSIGAIEQSEIDELNNTYEDLRNNIQK